jgi:hypothetical protein
MGRMIQTDTEWWSSGYVQGDENNKGLDITERYLYKFFEESPLSTVAGIYILPMKTLTVLSGLEKNQIEMIVKRLENDFKILYREGWVVIPDRYISALQEGGPKVKIGAEKILNKAPNFVHEFIKKAFELKEKKEKREGENVEKGSIPYTKGINTLSIPTTQHTTTPHPIDLGVNYYNNINTEIFSEILAFFEAEYTDKTKGLILTWAKFEKEDLEAIWQKLPDKREIVRAWRFYCVEYVREANEHIEVRRFITKYSKIQQRLFYEQKPAKPAAVPAGKK